MYASAVPVSNAVLASGGAELVKTTHKKTISIRKSLVDVVTNHLVGLFIFFVLIAYFENEHLENDEAFSEYKILFELIRLRRSNRSAYGNVGVSLGYPGVPYSFSGKFTAISKFILCLVMLMGRNRSLPPAINKDIVLDTADAGLDALGHVVIEVVPRLTPGPSVQEQRERGVARASPTRRCLY
jgi:hypothetical protein